MTTEFKTSPCSGCGRPIVWAADDQDRRIPLDPRPAVYGVSEVDGRIICRRNRSAMVGHHATCPEVGQFKPPKGEHGQPVRRTGEAPTPERT